MHFLALDRPVLIWPWLAALALAGLAASAQAQVFKIECEVEGKIPSLDDTRIAPAKVTVELQTIGKHLYFNVVGPRYYQMQVSSLVTEAYLGTNLSSSTRIGARRKHRASDKESEIVIERSPVELIAHHDIDYKGKSVRLDYAGKCKVGS